MKKDFCLFLAGLGKAYYETIEKILDNMDLSIRIGGLVSYLDNKKTLDNLVEFRKNFNDNEFNIMLDSGAFTYNMVHFKMSSGVEITGNRYKSVVSSIQNNKIEEYLDKYVNYVRDNDWDFYVELDIQPVVGADLVLKWREKWKNNDLEPFLVYHGEDDEYIREMCYDSSRTGIGGDAVDTKVYAGKKFGRNKKITAAQKIRKIKKENWIHWFGIFDVKFTSKLLQLELVNSIDATSWKISRFGKTYIITNNRLMDLHIGKKAAQVNLKRFYDFINQNKNDLYDIGINIDDLKNRKNNELDKLSIYSLVTYYNRIYEQRKGKQNSILDWF